MILCQSTLKMINLMSLYLKVQILYDTLEIVTANLFRQYIPSIGMYRDENHNTLRLVQVSFGKIDQCSARSLLVFLYNYRKI